MVTVLLTGGNGFIAAHIIDQLLNRGDDVIFTVRSEQAGKGVVERYRNQASSGNLQFKVVEDLTRPGAMDEIFQTHQDITYVLHTASPFIQQWEDAAADVLEPAIEGTKQTLRSIHANAPSVKRVVILSSFVTFMVPPAADDKAVMVYDGSTWNPVTWEAAVAQPRLTYTGSKTLAEKAAWDFIHSNTCTFDLATLNPPLVFGPIHPQTASLDKINTSNRRVLAMVQGSFKDGPLPPTGVYLWVDVRDVAAAHLRAMETPEAGGKRFLLVGGHFSNKTLADAIVRTHARLAEKLPEKSVDDTPANVYQFDCKLAGDVLGMEFRGFEDCVRDTVASLLEAGA